MKIEITKPIPVERHYRPTIGRVYEVLETVKVHKQTAYVIVVGSTEVTVFWHECKVLQE